MALSGRMGRPTDRLARDWRASVGSARFLRVVRPGDELVYEATLLAKVKNLVSFKAVSLVGPNKVATCELCIAMMMSQALQCMICRDQHPDQLGECVCEKHQFSHQVSNAVINCGQCQDAVHPLCYGTSALEVREQWLCDKCSYPEPADPTTVCCSIERPAPTGIRDARCAALPSLRRHHPDSGCSLDP